MLIGYVCRFCGFTDDTDAEFDNSRTICEGCMIKHIQQLRDRGAKEYKLGDYTVLELAVGDSCGDCGSYSLEIIAWRGDGFADYDETLLCASCDSVMEYFYPNGEGYPVRD